MSSPVAKKRPRVATETTPPVTDAAAMPVDVWKLLIDLCPHAFWLCGVNRFLHDEFCVPKRTKLSVYQRRLESYLIFRLQNPASWIRDELIPAYWAPKIDDNGQLQRALNYNPHLHACRLNGLLRCITTQRVQSLVQSCVVMALRSFLTDSAWTYVSAPFNHHFLVQMCREAFVARGKLPVKLLYAAENDGLSEPWHQSPKPILLQNLKEAVASLLMVPGVLAPRYSEQRVDKLRDMDVTIEKFTLMLYTRAIYEPRKSERECLAARVDENVILNRQHSYEQVQASYSIVSAAVIDAIVTSRITRASGRRMYRQMVAASEKRVAAQWTQSPLDTNLYALCLLLEDDQQEWRRIFDPRAVPTNVLQWHKRFTNPSEFVYNQFTGGGASITGHLQALVALYATPAKVLLFVQLLLDVICDERSRATIETLWHFIECHYTNKALNWAPVAAALKRLYFGDVSVTHQFTATVLLHLTESLARAQRLHEIIPSLLAMPLERFGLRRATNKKTQVWISQPVLVRFVGELQKDMDGDAPPPWLPMWCDLIARLPQTSVVIAEVLQQQQLRRPSGKKARSKAAVALTGCVWDVFRDIFQQPILTPGDDDALAKDLPPQD